MGRYQFRWHRSLIPAFLSILFLVLAISKYFKEYSFLINKIEYYLGGDLPLHLVFSTLVTLLIFWLIQGFKRKIWHNISVSTILLIVFSADEFLQRYSSVRVSKLEDFLFSLCGWLLANLLFFVCYFFLKSKK